MKEQEVIKLIDEFEKYHERFPNTDLRVTVIKAFVLITKIREKVTEVDEISICDSCKKPFQFSKGVIHYIKRKPKLLCPKCSN